MQKAVRAHAIATGNQIPGNDGFIGNFPAAFKYPVFQNNRNIHGPLNRCIIQVTYRGMQMGNSHRTYEGNLSFNID
jgi:hypothetical protein